MAIARRRTCVSKAFRANTTRKNVSRAIHFTQWRKSFIVCSRWKVSVDESVSENRLAKAPWIVDFAQSDLEQVGDVVTGSSRRGFLHLYDIMGT